MANAAQRAVVRELLEKHGRTFSEEIGIYVEHNTPSPLFQLLCASLLFSARIGANIAVTAAQSLIDQGWTTPQKMKSSTWEKRARVLNEAGYARYDERTASMLGDTAEMLLDRYGGDLRKLREEAQRNPDREHELLKAFKGIGDTGADIFSREVQVAWDELHPFADKRALKSARRLDLPDDPKALAGLVSKKEYARLIAALIRVQFEGEHEAVLDEAQQQ